MQKTKMKSQTQGILQQNLWYHKVQPSRGVWKRTKANRLRLYLLSDAAGHGVGEGVGVLLPEGVAHGPERGEDGARRRQLLPRQVQPLTAIQAAVHRRRTLHRKKGLIFLLTLVGSTGTYIVKYLSLLNYCTEKLKSNVTIYQQLIIKGRDI